MGNILLICQKAGDDSGESTGRRRSVYRTVYSTGAGEAGYTAADGVTACNIGKYAVAEIDYITASERGKVNSGKSRTKFPGGCRCKRAKRWITGYQI